MNESIVILFLSKQRKILNYFSNGHLYNYHYHNHKANVRISYNLAHNPVPKKKWRRDYSRLHLSIVFRFCLSSIQISNSSVDFIPQHKVEIFHLAKCRQSTVFFDTVERGESRHDFIGADHLCDVCLLLIINKEDVGIPI